MVCCRNWPWLRFPSHRPGRSYLPGQYLAKVHLLQSILLKEGQAACLEVGGYLVEPRSLNMEGNLEEIAEVNIDIFIVIFWKSLQKVSYKEFSYFSQNTFAICFPPMLVYPCADSVQHCCSWLETDGKGIL